MQANSPDCSLQLKPRIDRFRKGNSANLGSTVAKEIINGLILQSGVLCVAAVGAAVICKPSAARAAELRRQKSPLRGAEGFFHIRVQNLKF
jgi:hypothetical protein